MSKISPHSLLHLKNRHAGQDVFVLGSGASMDYMDRDFFRNRIAIGCNYVYERFPVSYTVAKELPKSHLVEACQSGSVPVVSEFRYGFKDHPVDYSDLSIDYYVFPHRHNACTEIDWSILGTDELVVSYSTITSAIHLAAYMGAKTVFLCGHDCGAIDGKLQYSGYRSTLTAGESADWYRGFLRTSRDQTPILRDKLFEVYNCRVVLISPFVNLSHEGHVFES